MLLYVRALACSFMLCAVMSAQASAATAPSSNAVASDTGTVSGKVVDLEGKPLGRAHVFISGPTTLEMLTAPDGTFKASLPRASIA
jgi:hypothetical protein